MAKKQAARKVPETAGLARLTRYPKMLQQYLREVVYELKKVVWPSRRQTVGTTAVVLVVVIAFGIYLGLVDAILSRLVRFLIG
ncbi:preprotein translocase subunit SecE [Thermodesulforhabdus norvegica]|uniref:Protein translocase subunit SecE n=1 Tax=Thermodesulforhabdus norvegica TaxID=39841 RepID=A0A1I4WDI8_9BACT|nr:preprotein translocase subunit SecE [Thermodesulforhabdus norvegica]SFN11423.1 preprotein translocase subunit SecE [Thermodesulforhabdus norvegica]